MKVNPVFDDSDVEKPALEQVVEEIRTVVAMDYLVRYPWLENQCGRQKTPVRLPHAAGTAFEIPPCR